MFGFGRKAKPKQVGETLNGEKAKLKHLGGQLKGASLQEVVEKFADEALLERPAVPYSQEIALAYKKDITYEEELDVDLLTSRIQKITKENNFEEGSEQVYVAFNTTNLLKKYALDLQLATKLMSSKEEAAAYLFDTWVKNAPIYYVLPIIFPPQCRGRIEDFSIGRDYRFAMNDELFARLKSIEAFSTLVNAFAEEHPYFRQYPL